MVGWRDPRAQMDALDIIGLQAAVASGSEDTFDDQQLIAGVQLRWSFAAELGFPPYGFWLYRRVATDGERRIPIPEDNWQTGGRDVGRRDEASLPWKPARYEWQARTPEPSNCVVVRGVAAARVDSVTVETCAHLTDHRVVVTGRKRVRVGANRRFEITVRGTAITAVRVTGARAVESCEYSTVEPPSMWSRSARSREAAQSTRAILVTCPSTRRAIGGRWAGAIRTAAAGSAGRLRSLCRSHEATGLHVTPARRTLDHASDRTRQRRRRRGNASPPGRCPRPGACGAAWAPAHAPDVHRRARARLAGDAT